jgi:hypothetical protein
VEHVFAATIIGPGQLRWAALDVDIELEALVAPERYPLVWRQA